MRFQCPFCRGIVAVDNNDMGSDVQCGHCGEVVTVPCSRLATGAVIADFIILEELGRGGMGIVYLAHQVSLDRPAAVKILADSFANNAEFVVNFIKEARAAAKLNHPHIVQAYAVGEDEGVFYFAMEHIDGETMKQVLRRDKIINVEKCITIIQQIAEALDYAWKEAKLVHRDIKPDNIMLTKNGRAKLADLGLSKVAGDAEDAESDEVMGTPQYISPEHLTGAPMDVRSDVYSLGATFYHLITGRFPFEGRTATEIARKHLEEPLVPPQLVNPEIPIAVGQIIEKMMAKNIKSRYQDAEQLVDDLRMVRRGKRPPTATQGVKPMPGQTKLGITVSATKRQLQTQLKTINMHLTGMMSKSQTGTVADLDSLASLELKRQRRRKLLFLAGIVIIAGIGAFLLYHFYLAKNLHQPGPGKPSRPGRPGRPQPDQIVKGPEGKPPEPGVHPNRPSASPYVRRISKLLEFYRQNPNKKDDFMGRVDDFIEAFPAPRSKFEQESLNELLAIFVPLDETLRVDPARNKLESKYLSDLEKVRVEKQRKLEEQRRLADERRRKLEAERQRKLEEERKRNSYEARRKRQADKFIASVNTQKVVIRSKVTELLANRKFDEADKFISQDFSPKVVMPKNPVKAESIAVEDFNSWIKVLRNGVHKGITMNNLIHNGGDKLAGLGMELRGNLVKIESIKNGIVDVKSLTGGNIDKIPFRKLPSKNVRIIIKNAAKKMNDDDARFYYYMVTGHFKRRIERSDPRAWRKEYSAFVTSYIKHKWQNASEREKRELKRKYESLREFKKATR